MTEVEEHVQVLLGILAEFARRGRFTPISPEEIISRFPLSLKISAGEVEQVLQKMVDKPQNLSHFYVNQTVKIEFVKNGNSSKWAVQIVPVSSNN